MKLLVASDGSENSLRAVRYGVDLIGRLKEGGSIGLISVHDDTALKHAKRFVGTQAVEDYLREMSEGDLAESRRLLEEAGVKYETVIRTGYVAAEITKAASDGAYDIILMGSKGRSGLGDLLIGSVAKRVSEMATTPVLLVR